MSSLLSRICSPNSSLLLVFAALTVSVMLLCGNTSCVCLEGFFMVSVFLMSSYVPVVDLVMFVLPDSCLCYEVAKYLWDLSV